MDKEKMIVDTLVYAEHKENGDPLRFFAFLPFPVVRAIIEAGGLDRFVQIPFDTEEKPLPEKMLSGEFHIDELLVPMKPVEEYHLN